MGTYGLKGIIEAWDMDKLTTEQAIGQILLLLTDLHERITALEKEARAKTKLKSTPPPPAAPPPQIAA